MKNMEELDIWIKTPPLEERETSFKYVGKSRFDKDTTRLISEKFKAPYNSRIMTPHIIQYGEGGLKVDVGECLFSEHQILNKTKEVPNGRMKALEQRAFPMAVMCLTLTSDNRIVFSRRNFKYTHARGKITLSPGGYVDVALDSDNGLVRPTLTARREYKEEFGAEESTIRRLNMHGMTFSNGNNFGCSLSYKLETGLTFQELKAHYDKSHDFETKEILEIEFSRDSIRRFIRLNLEEMSNHALGTCLLVGRNEFGEEWYEEILKELQKKWKIIEAPNGFFSGKSDVNETIRALHQAD